MAEETQTLEQTLESTGLGHFVNTNKDTILMGMGVIIAAIIGYSIYQHNSTKNEQAELNKVYQFSQTKVIPFLDQKDDDNKITNEQVVSSLSNAPEEILANSNFLPILFNVTLKLEDKAIATKLIPVYEKVISKYNLSDYSYLFIALKLGVLYENNGDLDKAISTLEKLVSSGQDLAKTKVYLDLGRLYKKTGNNEKAKVNFEFIVKNNKNADLVKLAKLYLLQL